MAARAKRDGKFWYTPTSLEMPFYKGDVLDGDLGYWVLANYPAAFEPVGDVQEPDREVPLLQHLTAEQTRAVGLAADAADPALYGYKQPGPVDQYPDPRQAAFAEKRYAERREAGDFPEGLEELHARRKRREMTGAPLVVGGPVGVQADGSDAGAVPSAGRPSPAGDRIDTPMVEGDSFESRHPGKVGDRDAAQRAADQLAQGADVFDVAREGDDDADGEPDTADVERDVDDADPEGGSADSEAGFDPSAHNGPQVIEYVKAHPEQRAAVRKLEREGRARTTVLTALAEPGRN